MVADFKFKAPEIPRNYPVPDFGVDRDIMWSLNNLENEEKKIGTWSLDGEVPKANAPTNAGSIITRINTEDISAKPIGEIASMLPQGGAKGL